MTEAMESADGPSPAKRPRGPETQEEKAERRRAAKAKKRELTAKGRLGFSENKSLAYKFKLQCAQLQACMTRFF